MIRTTFKYPEINDTHRTKYTFGVQNAGDILREDGDWRNFTPPPESQALNGVDPSDCYIEAQLHSIATIQEEKFGLIDQVYAPRFNVVLSGGTPEGGDPLVGADSIRNDGVIPNGMMPFDSSITSFEDFASWKGANEKLCRAAGQLFKTKFKANNYIVFQKEDSLITKYAQLREALKRSPCPISVYGVVGNDLQYVPKPQGANDTHLVLALYLSPNNEITIFDTYPPYVKTLPANYDSDFCLRWNVEQVVNPTPTKMSLGQLIVHIWRSIFSSDYRVFGSQRSSGWPAVRAKHLEKFPTCAICGGNKKITVHHRLPFHIDKSLELLDSNLITLCEGAGNGNHHLIFGHYGNYATKWNPNIDEDVKKWFPRFQAKNMNDKSII